jgi:hypothetical protein
LDPHRYDAGPDRNFHFDADPEPGPDPEIGMHWHLHILENQNFFFVK